MTEEKQQLDKDFKDWDEVKGVSLFDKSHQGAHWNMTIKFCYPFQCSNTLFWPKTLTYCRRIRNG